MTDQIDEDILDAAFDSLDDNGNSTADNAVENIDEASLESALDDALDLNAAPTAPAVAPEVDLMAEMAAAMEVAAAEDAVNPAMGADGGDVNAAAILQNISSSDIDVETLLKVPIALSIEVGRTRMPLSELLETHEGSVIELSRKLDEPLDILVNGALIAHGVVVLANERFGIQITDIISLKERAQRL